uniref:B30.2/SPRY domain-containing protein n=1 Tax=Salarias fasciatus TaxID=181472 RepID=A0A672FUF6_SALFA
EESELGDDLIHRRAGRSEGSVRKTSCRTPSKSVLTENSVSLPVTCDLSLDPNTVHKSLILSDCGRTVSRTKEKQPYPDHPERFSTNPQLLCREALTGRCYWEVEWNGRTRVGVAYKSIPRKERLKSSFKHSDKSWCHVSTLLEGFYFKHNNKSTYIPASQGHTKAFRSRVRRLGLFLDWPAGTLSFYQLSGETKTLIHTFHTTFTEPLYPAFLVDAGTLTLCEDGSPEGVQSPQGERPDFQ